MTQTHDAACHCGTVRLRVALTDGLATARRCDCSFCRMRGAVAVSAPLSGIEIVAGADALTLYEWGTRTARHWFCSVCGIYTHHQRRSNPDQYGVNAAGPVVFSVVDAAGRTVGPEQRRELGVGLYTQRMDVSQLPRGVYFLRITGRGQTVSQPFVKQ